MLGAIIGDIVGSVYEFSNWRDKNFPFYIDQSRPTDDTVCTVAVADCIMNGLDPAASFIKWCSKYPRAGYGTGFRQWMGAKEQKPYGSFGNGAAMRVSPAAFLADSLEMARHQAIRVTEVTHNHPEGVKGALATTDAIWLAFEGHNSDTIREHIAKTYDYDMKRTCDQIRPSYKFYESCQKTVPEAIICALEATSFEDAIRNAISIGGDSDTIGAITGSIAEARFGIPISIVDEALLRLTDELRQVIQQMYSIAKRSNHGWLK